MLLMRPPGVYRPQADTSLLSESVGCAAVLGDARVLDVCTGTGVLAMAAARGGAAEVTATDISSRAVLAARLNALAGRVRLRVLRGDLFAPVSGERFDVIVSNPPYVIGGSDPRGKARSWEAGPRGRLLLDRICSQAPRHLAPGGTLLLVHSAFSDAGASLRALHEAGLRAFVAARRSEPFGPVMLSKAALLERRDIIRPGQRFEELVVIRADRTPAGRVESPDHALAG